MIQEVVCQPRFMTPTEMSGIMIAPPARNAALLMDMTRPRYRINHVLRAAVVACMNEVDDPMEITKRYMSMKAIYVSACERMM